MTKETELFFSKKLFLGKDLKVNEHISIKSPKLKEIIAFGEERYFNLIKTLITIPPAEVLINFCLTKPLIIIQGRI